MDRDNRDEQIKRDRRGLAAKRDDPQHIKSWMMVDLLTLKRKSIWEHSTRVPSTAKQASTVQVSREAANGGSGVRHQTAVESIRKKQDPWLSNA